jgi:hypothetical protein
MHPVITPTAIILTPLFEVEAAVPPQSLDNDPIVKTVKRSIGVCIGPKSNAERG